MKELAKVLGADEETKSVSTDNSLEFGKACEDLSWDHCTWTPHRSETNGIAERAVRRVKEGTSAVLLQSGLNKSWWADSMECYTYPRNIQDLLSDGKTHRAFNPFSKESKDAIMAAGNTELCEIVDVEPRSQCRACLTYWSAGIVYCTCGHLMEDDTTENKKYISS